MEKEIIDQREYDYLNETTKYDEKDVNVIIETYEYLKDKKVFKSYGKTKVKIENLHLDYLRIALGRAYYNPNINKATKDFIKSDYLSYELKKEIYSVIKPYASKKILDLLTSDISTNNFTSDEIRNIYDLIEEMPEVRKRRDIRTLCENILDVYEIYFFTLDGEGPINFIKELDKETLPLIMLQRSGVIDSPSYYSGYGVDSTLVGEDHLFSLYKKFLKFYPESADEYVRMVRKTPIITPTEFVSNYLKFVNNDFNSEFETRRGNISLDGTYGSQRDLVGAASLFSMFDDNNQNDSYKDWKKDMERIENGRIKDRFKEKVDIYKSLKKDVKTLKNKPE